MGAPSTLPADFFDHPQTAQSPDVLPADFFDHPIDAQPAKPEDHPALAASRWDKTKAAAEAVPAVFSSLTNKASEIYQAPLVPESVMPGPATTPAGAVGRSALEFARGMTSPSNITAAALMGPVGKIAPLLGRA